MKVNLMHGAGGEHSVQLFRLDNGQLQAAGGDLRFQPGRSSLTGIKLIYLAPGRTQGLAHRVITPDQIGTGGRAACAAPRATAGTTTLRVRTPGLPAISAINWPFMDFVPLRAVRRLYPDIGALAWAFIWAFTWSVTWSVTWTLVCAGIRPVIEVFGGFAAFWRTGPA